MKRFGMVTAIAALGLLTSACTATTAQHKNTEQLTGPPVTHVKTVYDDVLVCARNALQDADVRVVSISNISDETGKIQLDGGNGRYVTQAPDVIMQSAWYAMQPEAVVNRVDTSVSEWENQAGRDLAIQASDFYVGGAITSIDFVPGGGFDIGVAGVGVKARQYRMSVAMNINATDTYTTRMIGDQAVFKEIVAYDTGVGVGRFFGDTLVSLDIGGQEREAVGFAVANMLKYTAFELASEVYGMPMNECRKLVENVEDVNDLE